MVNSIINIILKVSKTSPYKLGVIYLLFFVNLTFVQAQNNQQLAEDNGPGIKSVSTAMQLSTLPAVTLLLLTQPDVYLYEELSLQKNGNLGQKKNNFIPTQIERSHYTNNPFDIDDFSNPFSLPRPGSSPQKTTTNKIGQNSKKFLGELFDYQPVTSSKPGQQNNIPFWMLFVILGVLSFFTYNLSVFKIDIQKNLQAFASSLSATQLYKEQKNKTSLGNFSLFTLFVANMGIFVYLAYNLLQEKSVNQQWSFSFLLLSMLSILTIYILKYSQLKLISSIFPFHQEIEYYGFLIGNSNRIIGLGLVPVIVLLAYTPANLQSFTLYTSLIFLGICFLYRGIRGIIGASEIILLHKFHFFIYLCTVEIAPILILLKFFSLI